MLASKSYANVFVYLHSIHYLSRTDVRLIPVLPVQSLSYPLQSLNLLPFNRFLIPYKLPFNRFLTPSITPIQSHFYPLTIPQLTPLQSLSYSLTIVRLTPYNRLTYPPSNALLIPYKPWPYSRSIDCLSRNNVRLIPLQFHTKVQIYPH